MYNIKKQRTFSFRVIENAYRCLLFSNGRLYSFYTGSWPPCTIKTALAEKRTLLTNLPLEHTAIMEIPYQSREGVDVLREIL